MRVAILVCMVCMACGTGPGPGPATADGGDAGADATIENIEREAGYRGTWQWTTISTMPPVELRGGGIGALVFDTDPPDPDIIKFVTPFATGCLVRIARDPASPHRFVMQPGQQCMPRDSGAYSNLTVSVFEGSFSLRSGAASGAVTWSIRGTHSTVNPPSMTSFAGRVTMEFGPLQPSPLR
jgi:hypothetical protein